MIKFKVLLASSPGQVLVHHIQSALVMLCHSAVRRILTQPSKFPEPQVLIHPLTM